MQKSRSLTICNLFTIFLIFCAASFSQAQTTDDEPIESWDSTLAVVKEHKSLRDNIIEKIGDTGTDTLRKLYELLQELSIRYKVSTSTELTDGLDLKLQYSAETAPAFYGKYFERSDKWQLSPSLSVLEVLGQESNFGIGISPSIEVEFRQYFEEFKDALNPKNAYMPNRLPLKSKEALEKLKPGDLVSIDGQMSIFYGYSDTLNYLNDDMRVIPTVGGIISGHFRVYIFRGDDDMVRLRVGAVRDNPKFISIEAGLFDLLDLGWSPLTKLVTRLLKLKSVAEMRFEKYNRDTLITDFTLDMRDPRVQEAYDNLFVISSQSDALLQTANPFNSDKKLRNQLHANVARLIELSIETSKDIKPAVVMNFSGSNFATGTLKNVEGGASVLLRGQNETVGQFNNLKQVTYNSDGTEQNKFYVFPSWSERHKHSAAATKWEEKSNRYSNVVYSADEDYNIVAFENIGFYHDYTDKEYSTKEHKKMLKLYQKTLPPHIYQEFTTYLEDNAWLKLKNRRDNVRMSGRYFIHGEALAYGEALSLTDFEDRIHNAVKALDANNGRVLLVSQGMKIAKCLRKYGYVADRKGFHVGPNIFEYCTKISKTAEILKKSMDSTRNKNERNMLFVSLAKNSLFQMVGPGVLFNIIPAEILSEVTFFEIAINSSDLDQPLAFRHGKTQDRKLYEMILQIQNIMNDETPDLRLPGLKETTTTRIYTDEAI